MSDYGHALTFGTFITPQNQHPDLVLSLARLTEEAGLDLATFQDHPYQSKFLDTWTLMSYVLAQTKRISVSPNVINLPLRPPAVLARAAASLDLLSDGRLELGLGAGAFWDAIEAMGGRRLSPGQAVDALSEGIDIIRGVWNVDERRGLRVPETWYQVNGMTRGPAPAHDIGIWLGAYKPRMLRLTAQKADGWLPSLGYMTLEQLAEGNAVIDDAALAAGRTPQDIRRLVNINGTFTNANEGFLVGPPEQWVQQLTDLALTYGIGTFILGGDDPAAINIFGNEVAPAVRELVAAARGSSGPEPTSGGESGPRISTSPQSDSTA
jgi:alkanesulfonate monooxygenase SsuD/methylene tetrahydromethanopterin reductase-like flavin-dependent oxidoreductase (luciferase family)